MAFSSKSCVCLFLCIGVLTAYGKSLVEQETTTTEPEAQTEVVMMDSIMEDEKSEISWNKELTLNKMGDVQLKISSEDTAWITMEMRGPGKGYISVGLSPDGGMNNSDIVMGWIDAEGKAQLKDLHGVGNTKPKEDPEQNYELISGEQSDSETIIRFRRRWANCDTTHDRALETGDYKIIWAYNEVDPELSGKDGVFLPPYHFTNRGVQDVKIEVPKGDLEKSCE